MPPFLRGMCTSYGTNIEKHDTVVRTRTEGWVLITRTRTVNGKHTVRYVRTLAVVELRNETERNDRTKYQTQPQDSGTLVEATAARW